MTVADLLTRSHAAHKQAQVCRKAGNRAGHLLCCAEASDLRMQADALDPEHTDPAWAAEVLKKFRHSELLAFYAHELGERPLTPTLTREQLAAKVGVPEGMELEKSLAYAELCRAAGYVEA